MKLIHVALCACAISGCAIDGNDDEQSTTQEVKGKPLPPFFGEMGLDGDCTVVNAFANWIVPLSTDGYIRYTITDLKTKISFETTADVAAGSTTDNRMFTNVLQPLKTGQHWFTLKTELGTTETLLYADSYRTRFPCSL